MGITLSIKLTGPAYTDIMNIILYLAFISISVLFCPSSSQSAGPTCAYKSGGKTFQINQGDVTEIRKTTVRVCENGKTILKKKEDVPKPFKYGCNGCTFNGKLVCQGVVAKDLHRWWFLARCENGRMNAVGRSWLDVVKDPRYVN